MPFHFIPKLVRAVAVLCFGVVSMFAASPVAADAGRSAAVLPWISAGDSNAVEQVAARAQEVEHALAERKVEVLDTTLLRMRLLAVGRFPVPALTDGERSEFQALSRKAWVAVGRQDLAEAKRAIGAAMAFARARLEALNRTDALAQSLLDLCLLTPRVMLNERASRQLVVLEALECRKLVPRLSPSENDHLPEVLAAVQEADKLMRSNAPAKLLVQGASVEGCSVFLNGRRIGQVPYSEPLVPATYLVQVECPEQFDGTGLVHELSLSSGKTTTLEIQPFETFLCANEQRVFLARDVAGQQRPHALAPEASLGALARALEVDQVVYVRSPSASLLQLGSVDASDGATDCVSELDANPLEAKLDALAACTAAHARPVSSVGPKVDEPSAHTWSFTSTRTPAQRLTGIVLSATGLALLAGAWIGDGVTVNRDQGSSDFIYIGLGAAGAALAMAGEPLWTPIGKRHAAWWSWTVMAVGVAPAVASGLLFAKQDTCELHQSTGGCATFYNTRTRAALSLVSAVPLLTLPLSHYVARWLWGREVSANVAPTLDPKTGAMGLSLRGTFL